MIIHNMKNKSNYDRFPATSIKDGMLIKGWDGILNKIIPHADNRVISIEWRTFR